MPLLCNRLKIIAYVCSSNDGTYDVATFVLSEPETGVRRMGSKFVKKYTSLCTCLSLINYIKLVYPHGFAREKCCSGFIR